MSRRLFTALAGIAVLAVALAGCFGNGTTPTNTGQPGSLGPGLYRTLGDTPGGKCTITRKDVNGVDHTYQNLTGGPLYIRVKPDDQSVTSSECTLWSAAGFVPPIFVTSTIGSTFRSGDYRVGYEIQPGTYRAAGTGSGSCTYERVSDFTHDSSNVLETHTVPATGTPTIQILNTDFGFWSQNCGDWTRIS